MGLFDSLKKIVSSKAKPKKKAGKKAGTKLKSKSAGKSKAKTAKKVSKPKKKLIKKTRKATVKIAKKPVKKAPQAVQEKQIGVITHYFGKISVGIIKLKDVLKVGDEIHIKGAHDDFTQSVNSLQFNHKAISSAAKGKEVGVKVKQPVHLNDKVYISAK